MIAYASDETRERDRGTARVAAAIVDALLRASVVAPADVETALKIVARELARKPE